MGRAAKLRAARDRSTIDLRRRRLTRDAVGLDRPGAVQRTCPIDLRDLFKQSPGGRMPTNAEMAAAADLCDTIPPTTFTQYMGAAWLIIMKSSWQQLDQPTKLRLHVLFSLPEPVWVAYAELQGALILRPSAKHDWNRLRQNAITIAWCPELRDELIRYASREPSETCIGIFHTLSGPVHAIPEKIPEATADGVISAADGLVYALHMDNCVGHIDAVGDLYAGRVLHAAGRLVLHYRYAERQQDAELCLSFCSDDGFLCFFPAGGSATLPTACVRSMQSFVRSYEGPRMAGKISPHSAAARLCRLIGLQVRDGYGILG
jgi:hypothetical protein